MSQISDQSPQNSKTHANVSAGAKSNSKHSINDIQRLVNYAIARQCRRWQLSPTEIEDLRQDGVLAALIADRSYNPSKAAWSTWLLRRVMGQLKDSLAVHRAGGIVGGNATLVTIRHESGCDSDTDDEAAVSEESAYEGSGPLERAEIAEAMERLRNSLGLLDQRILALYYGLDDGIPLTVTQLSKRLGYARRYTFDLLQRARRNARMALDGTTGEQK